MQTPLGRTHIHYAAQTTPMKICVNFSHHLFTLQMKYNPRKHILSLSLSLLLKVSWKQPRTEHEIEHTSENFLLEQ